MSRIPKQRPLDGRPLDGTRDVAAVAQAPLADKLVPLQAWRIAYRRLDAYLAMLGIEASARRPLVAAAFSRALRRHRPALQPARLAMDELHGVLGERYGRPGQSRDRSAFARLTIGLSQEGGLPQQRMLASAFRPMPASARSPVRPASLEHRFVARACARVRLRLAHLLARCRRVIHGL